MKKMLRFALFLLPAAAFALGCTSAQVAFPSGADKAGFDKSAVKGRGGFSFFTEKISFGGYSVKLTRGWTSSESSSSFIPFVKDDKSEKEQKYSFTIKGPDGFEAQGKCRAYAKAETTGVKIMKLSLTDGGSLVGSLDASFMGSDGKKSDLALTGSIEAKTGTLKGNGITFDVKSTSSVEGSKWVRQDITGYYICEGDKAIAVVDVMSDGAVYIQKGIKKEYIPAVISAATALLSYKDLAKDIRQEQENQKNKKKK